MSQTVVKFTGRSRSDFFKEVNRQVNQYFKENNLSRHANLSMKLKTAFMLCLYFVPLAAMLSGIVGGLWPVMLMWILMGLGMSGIGLSIMHDANHGSYSSDPRVNDALGRLLNFIGGYHINWKIQHNVLHHSSTNVEGFDEDIAKPHLLRMSPHQKRKAFFRFQAFYAPLLYGVMAIYWLVGKDFQQLIRYQNKGLLKAQGINYPKALRQVVLYKSGYVCLTLLLPLLLVALPWWQTLLGFLLMQVICGIVLALIFQPAHVIEETEFYVADENGSLENNWAIHQLATTANFANNSRVFSWLVGGLNFQIEHHLFPRICHVHYRPISKIVKKVAAEFNLPYHQHRTFFSAVRSHFSLLHELGTGRYDQRMARLT